MPKLSPQEFNALWRQQEEVESQRRGAHSPSGRRKQRAAAAELAHAVINLNDKYTRAILRGHAGFTLAERRDAYLTSLAIMEQCLEDLLAAICVFENAALAETPTLDDAELRRFERRIQKELFATADAAASLVEHARRVDKCHALPEYQAKRVECFGTDGLHDFVIALRVMLHHLHMVEAGWNMTSSFSDGTKTATFKISKQAVLRGIEANPDRFQGPTHAAMRAYVDAAEDSIDLRAVFCDYRARMAGFHAWLKVELESETLIALRDHDALIQRKVNADQLMFWKAMPGNWLLNWNTPPDPHKHLPRYLSKAQLEEVYKRPRNSKEQVDLVIRFMDKHNAVDDALRQQAYQLFERSPP